MTAVLAGAVALGLLGGAAAAEEKCGVCHPDVRVAFEQSVHARESVGCVSCHGGTAASLEVAAAHRGSFRSLRERAGIPALCAECHADLRKMRPYNLPVDQYALYQTSTHGRAVAGGEERAAVCSDCHGAHDIRAPQDPQSRVYSRNLPATCGRCHGDAELMRELGLDPAVVDEYRSSIHGRQLFDDGNLAAPNCTHCHGVHGAGPPGVGDVDKVCGACHIQARRAFLAGPHYPAMLAAGLPECAACHSNHAILPFNAADGLNCAECHDDGSPQVALGNRLATLITGAESEVEQAEKLVARAEKVPLDVEDHLARLDEARTYLTEALPLVHTVAIEPVEQITGRARSIGEEVQHELYRELDRRIAHLGLAVFWFYLLMTLAILIGYKRRLSREMAS